MARNESLQGAVFAKFATTSIPSSPSVGTTYRDENMNETQAGRGWPFRTIVDSSEFNEMMFRTTSLLNNLEQRGMLSWSPMTDYSIGSLSRGADVDTLFECTAANGPNVGGTHKPELSPTYWRVASFGTGSIARFVSTNTTAKVNDIIYCISGPVTITLPTGVIDGSFVRVASGVGITEASKVSVSGSAIDTQGATTVLITTQNSFIDFYWDAISNLWRSAKGGAGGGSGAGGIGKNIFEVFYSMSSEKPYGAADLSSGTLLASCDTTYPEFWAECIKQQTAGTIRCLTEQQWQAEATSNDGNCGAFVVDITAKSVRLPKILSYLRSGTDAQIGTYLNDAIRNITATWSGGVTAWTQTYSGAFYQSGNNTKASDVTQETPKSLGFDASRVVPTADENRPKTIYGKLYIQIVPVSGGSGTTIQLGDITAVATDGTVTVKTTAGKTLTGLATTWTVPGA